MTDLKHYDDPEMASPFSSQGLTCLERAIPSILSHKQSTAYFVTLGILSQDVLQPPSDRSGSLLDELRLLHAAKCRQDHHLTVRQVAEELALFEDGVVGPSRRSLTVAQLPKLRPIPSFEACNLVDSLTGYLDKHAESTTLKPEEYLRDDGTVHQDMVGKLALPDTNGALEKSKMNTQPEDMKSGPGEVFPEMSFDGKALPPTQLPVAVSGQGSIKNGLDRGRWVERSKDMNRDVMVNDDKGDGEDETGRVDLYELERFFIGGPVIGSRKVPRRLSLLAELDQQQQQRYRPNKAVINNNPMRASWSSSVPSGSSLDCPDHPDFPLDSEDTGEEEDDDVSALNIRLID